MAKSIPWNTGAVELKADQLGFLFIEKATDKSNPELSFEPNQLESLYATIAASGMPVKTQSLVLYGQELYEDSKHPKAIPAIHERNGRDGSPRPFAYDAAQLDGFAPVWFALRLNFYKPQLWAYSTPRFESANNGVRQAPLNIRRIDPNAAKRPQAQRAGALRRQG